MNTHSATIPKKQTPGPSIWQTPACLSAFRSDPIGFLQDIHQRYGDTVRIPLGLPLLSVTHPDSVRYVLQEHHKNYDKGKDYERMEPVLGKGLLTANGAEWKRHRKLAQPAFHRQRLPGFATTMLSKIAQRLDGWHRQGSTLQLDIHAELMALTLEITGESLFSTDLSSRSAEVGLSFAELLRMTNEYINALVPTPLWFPTPFTIKFRRELAVLDRVVKKLIEARMNPEGDTGEDLLGLLLSAHLHTEGSEQEKPLSVEEIRDEVMTLLLAGHETTANALSFAFLLLTQHRDIADKLYAETISVLGNRPPTYEDLPQLRYAKQVAEEVMRLYPPAWAIGRRAIAHDVIDGHAVAPGTHILMSQFLTQRDARFHPDPLRFDPERFAPDQVSKRHHGAYFPFAAGPRQCIGMGFAMMELQLVLSALIQKVEITVSAPEQIELEPLITLRPKNGMRAQVRFRQPS